VYIAFWGAVISTILAIVKGWEFYRDRPQLHTGYSFTSRPDIGNKIIIWNTSKVPVIIDYWELQWNHRETNKIAIENEICSVDDEGFSDLIIAPYSRSTLTFENDRFFTSTKPDLDLYINLHIVGKRKNIKKLVYGPSRNNH
jgi:hypothetical protein